MSNAAGAGRHEASSTTSRSPATRSSPSFPGAAVVGVAAGSVFGLAAPLVGTVSGPARYDTRSAFSVSACDSVA